MIEKDLEKQGRGGNAASSDFCLTFSPAAGHYKQQLPLAALF